MFPSLICLPAPTQTAASPAPCVSSPGLGAGSPGEGTEPVPSLTGTQRAGADRMAALRAAPHRRGADGGQGHLQGDPLYLEHPGRQVSLAGRHRHAEGASAGTSPHRTSDPLHPWSSRKSWEPGVQGACSHSRDAKAGSLLLRGDPGLGRFPGRGGSPPRGQSAFLTVGTA